MPTLYASFADAELAERAAGALIDHGVRSQDISLVTNQEYSQIRAARQPAAPPGINDVGDTVIYADQTAPSVRPIVTAPAVVPVAPPPVPATTPGAIPPAPGSDLTSTAASERADAAAARAAAVRAEDLGDPAAVARLDAEANRLAVDADRKERLAAEQSGVVVPVPVAGVPVAPPAVVPVAAPPGPPPVSAPAGAPVVVLPESAQPYDREEAAKDGITLTTAADAEAGAVKGAEVGLGLGILAGLATLFVPGIGLILGGGALAAAIGAAAATTAAGAIAGGVVGYLRDMGVPEAAAQSYHDAVAHGGAILAVTVPSGLVTAATIESMLAKYGAVNISIY